MSSSTHERQPCDLRLFRFVDCHGEPAPFEIDLDVLDTVKGGSSDRRRVLRVTDGRREMAMKITSLPRIGGKVATMLGRGRLRHEISMARLATETGLRALRPVAYGVVRRLGVPIAEAMLSEWIPNGVLLRQVVRQAVAAGDDGAVARAAGCYVDMIGRIREAGLADADCGTGQLLVNADSGAALDPIWIDLEASFPADPHDADATGRTLAAALVSWWVATGGDQSRYEQTARLISGRLPEPTGGWRRVEEVVDQSVRRRMAKQIRKRRIDDYPESVRFS